MDKTEVVKKISNKEMNDKIKSLSEKVDSLLSERDYFLSISKKNNRLSNIIDFLNERIPDGEERIYEKRLNQMLNE